MIISDDILLKILKIGHNTSFSGNGDSMANAIQKTEYLRIKNELTPDDLIRLIKEHPYLIDQWNAYSEEKRTNGGYYLEDKTVGRVSAPKTVFKFKTREQATAEYVVKELGFWSELDKE